MGRDAQVWVHPNLRYMGGTYDPYTERAFFGGPWPERVERSIKDFTGGSIAITTTKPDGESEQFPDVTGPHSDIPYARGMWDEVVEDARYGDLRWEHRPVLERWSETYDHITVRGGAFDVCLKTFVESYRAVDPDTPITVDAEHSYFDRGDVRVPLKDVHTIDWEERRARVADRVPDRPALMDEVRDELEALDNVTVIAPADEITA